MKEFEVFFEVFSKKMKTTVAAYNSEDAGLIVQKNLRILSVQELEEEEEEIEDEPEEDKTLSLLKKMFGMS